MRREADPSGNSRMRRDVRILVSAALLLTATLLSACSAPSEAPAAPPGAQAPGSITTHLNGRMDFFTGVSGSH